MQLIDTPFYAAIAIGFIWYLSVLAKRHKAYLLQLSELKNDFTAISSSHGVSINELSVGALNIARDICVIERRKGRRFVVFNDELVAINKSIHHLIPKPADRELKSVPAILTTLGILGTFTGISIGLYHLGNGWEDASQMANQARVLLSGMKTAFFTSILGMGTSGFFMFLLAQTQSKQNKAYGETVKILQAQSEEVSAADLLYGLLSSAENQENQQHDFSELVAVLRANAEQAPAITVEEFERITSNLLAEFNRKLSSLEDRVCSHLKSLALDEKTFAVEFGKELTLALPSILTKPLSTEIQFVRSEIEQTNSGLTAAVELLGDLKSTNEQGTQSITIEAIELALQQSVTDPLSSKLESGYVHLASIEHQNSNLLKHVSEFSHEVTTLSPKVEAVCVAVEKTNMSVIDTANLLSDIKRLKELGQEEFNIASIETLLRDSVTTPLSSELKSGRNYLMSIEHINSDLLKRLSTIPQEVTMPLTNKIEAVCIEVEKINTSVNSASQQLSEIKLLTERGQQELNIISIETVLRDSVTVPLSGEIGAGHQHLTNIEYGIKDLAKERTAEFEQLVDTMGEQIVKPITTELSITNKVVKDFAQVSDKLNQSVSKTVEEMVKATATVANFEQSTLVKLNDFAESMERSLNDFATNSTKALDSITAKVGEIVDLGSKSIEQQTQAFGSLVSDSETIFKEQAATLQQVGVSSAQLMEKAKHELEQGLGDIDTKVINMSHTVQTELEIFRTDYQNNLVDFFTAQNNALEDTLGKQRNSLVEVIDKFKVVFEDEYSQRHDLLDSLNDQYLYLMESAEKIEHLAKAVGLHESARMSELENAGNSIGRAVGQLNRAFENASQDFSHVASQMRPEMDSYFERANKGVEKYFSSFDKISSRIYSRLDRAAELLITAREEELAQQKEAKNESGAAV
ncbi:hypothetical protein L4D76_19460 [Photobacterium sagamiensis]|uniref:hypothetical protein n=1 Tax=Photobacterium sagamiensis TaxID=2910241 RepID=UPI003D0F308F